MSENGGPPNRTDKGRNLAPVRFGADVIGSWVAEASDITVILRTSAIKFVPQDGSSNGA
jgi:hypothetical protein